MTISTSAALRACTPRPPPKMTSRIDWPRTASGDCSPIAHSTASVMFDLPEPLGPTTTETPGAKSSLVRSGKDLKPLSVTERRCIGYVDSSSATTRGVHAGAATPARSARPPARRASSSAPTPRPTGSPATDATTSNVRSCGGPSSPAIGVLDGLRAARQALLQRGLEVDGVRQRVGDLRLEGLDDRGGRALVAVVQVARADHRLDHRGQDALGLDERVGALADARPAPRRAACRARRGARRPRGRRRPTRSGRGSSSAARRRSARPPGADRGAT